MKRMATIAVALAFVALVFQGGGARADNGNTVDATISVTIFNGNATFIVTYAPGVEIGDTIRLVPRPLVFTENLTTGCWETGIVSALLEIGGIGQDVSILKPIESGPYSNETVIKSRGPLEFPCSPSTPGFVTFGPLPLIEPDLQDPYGGNGPGIIVIEPDIQDPY